MDNYFRRTWAEIDLNRIEHNFKLIKKQLSAGTKMCCVIKADAYGHGALELAALYERLGASFFAVSNLEEALELRMGGIKTPILILGFTPASYVCELSDYNISQAVFSVEYAQELSEYAQSMNVTVKAHIKVDTGMSRIGLMCQNTETDTPVKDAVEIASLDGLSVEGIFTHFAVSDEKEEGRDYTEHQIDCFNYIINGMKENGFDTDKIIKHCSNSAAIMDYKNANMDMVRACFSFYDFYLLRLT